jgi:ketopantoate reductase
MATATRLPIGPIPFRSAKPPAAGRDYARGRGRGPSKGNSAYSRYAENRLALCDNLLADLISSMRKDLQRGSRLDVRWLSGSVVRLGKPLFIPTPVNEVIAGLLAPLAAGSR